MKKRVWKFLVFACLSASVFAGVPAYADIIWEPEDNFYRANQDDCEYEDRSYVTKEHTYIMSKPGSSLSVAQAEENVRFYVSYTWQKDDERWGIVEFDGGTGWVNMESMELIYDFRSFQEDHGDEFIPYEGQLDDLNDDETVTFWKYPNSGIVTDELDGELFDDSLGESVSAVYVDEEGRVWCAIGYWKGIRECWVCADDQNGDTLVRTEDTVKNDEIRVGKVRIKAGDIAISEYRMWVYAILLVIFVVILTIIIIRIFMLRRND